MARHSATESHGGNEMDELYRRLSPVMNPPKPDAIAAALEAAQRLAAEADAEDAATDLAHDPTSHDPIGASAAGLCRACGYRNRGGNKFCGMCGAAVQGSVESEGGFAGEARPSRSLAATPQHFPEPERETSVPTAAALLKQHHYHHH